MLVTTAVTYKIELDGAEASAIVVALSKAIENLSVDKAGKFVIDKACELKQMLYSAYQGYKPVM